MTRPTTKAGGVQYVRSNEEAKVLLRGLESWQFSVWVFPSENPATHVGPRNFYQRYYLLTVKELGLAGVRWHTLRHTFASRLAMADNTEDRIASLLRHSSTALMRRYAHLSPSYLQDAFEKVSRFGKAETTAPAKSKVNQEPERMEGKERTEVPDVLSTVSTGPGTGKAGLML